MKHFVAHPGEFLVVRFRDGRQQHLPGPAELWMDPREHLSVAREEALQVAAKEAVVVYSRDAEVGVVTRRIVHGPTLFVPAPGEWLHTFTWHGSDGGSEGVKKVARGLVFQKLWLMPDQMYHDVADVRTADDAVLTLRLMIFFELLDIERMLEATHDPIGDFINAATSDVVDFTGRYSFESFKQNTGHLNDLAAYPQLTGRAAQCGYRINKVVYRGYGAPDRLQAMHDQAIEARTRLQLERATEQQSQELEDYKLNAQLARATKRRVEQATEVEAEIELTRKRQEADLRQREAVRASARQHRWADAAADVEARAIADARQREHFAELRDLGVDLTAYLTQGRADRVIELRGAGGTHVHLDGVAANGKAGRLPLSASRGRGVRVRHAETSPNPSEAERGNRTSALVLPRSRILAASHTGGGHEFRKAGGIDSETARGRTGRAFASSTSSWPTGWALMDVVRRFEATDIRIVSLTVVDSADCAIIRMVLSNPERALEIFQQGKMMVTESDLLVVKLPDGRQPLASICKALLAAEISIDYAYPLMIGVGPEGHTALAIHVDDHETGASTLSEMGFTLYTEGDLTW